MFNKLMITTLTAACIASLCPNTSNAQEEEFKYVTKSQSGVFFGKAQNLVDWPVNQHVYDIEINGGATSGANNITHYLSGTSVIRSSGKETWIVGPASLEQIGDQMALNDARPLDVERVFEYGLPAVNAGGDYYAVLTRNQGTHNKATYWWTGISLSDLVTNLSATNSRLIDLELISGFHSLGTARYVAIAIANTRGDSRGSQFLVNQTEAGVQTFLAANPSYRARHIGYEGITTGQPGVRWNVIIEQTNEVSSSEIIFGYSKSGITNYASANKRRVQSLAYNRFNGTYNAILVPKKIYVFGTGGIGGGFAPKP